MNKLSSVFALAAVAVAGFGVTGVAHAQEDTLKVERPFRVKIGGFFPSSKNGSDSSWLSGGISYDFAKTQATNPTVYEFYGDYTENSNVRLYGVGVGARFLFAPPTEPGGQPYGTLGLGYYGTKFQGSSEKGALGGKVALGYQLQNGLFGEAEYDIIGETSGRKPSGFNLRVGYRF